MLWSCGLPLKLVDTNTLARTSKHRTYVHRVAYCLSKRRHAWSNMTRVEQVNAANKFHLNLYQRLQITPITSQWPEHFVTAWNDDPAALDLLWGAELKKSGGGGTCMVRPQKSLNCLYQQKAGSEINQHSRINLSAGPWLADCCLINTNVRQRSKYEWLFVHTSPSQAFQMQKL